MLALEAVGQLPDAEIDIADAALQLARVGAPEADWRAARAHLSELAREAVVLADGMGRAEVAARGAALSDLLGAHGYHGDGETFPDFANLIRVVERRAGLPVALGVLWLHAARAAGWEAHGLDFPGHFLLALEGDAGEGRLVLDVFEGGRRLDARALRGLLKRAEGASAELRPDMLRPMTTRGVLLRLQNNIKGRLQARGELEAALGCAQTMLLIAPGEAGLWREAAVMNQRLDRVSAALRCFDRFLDLVPDGDAAARVRLAVRELRARLN